MQHTHEESDQFKAMFAARRRRQIAATTPMIPLVLVLVTSDETAGTTLNGLMSITTFFPIALLTIGSILVFSLRNWRCPACDGYLGKALSLSACSKCGVGLKE